MLGTAACGRPSYALLAPSSEARVQVLDCAQCGLRPAALVGGTIDLMDGPMAHLQSPSLFQHAPRGQALLLSPQVPQPHSGYAHALARSRIACGERCTTLGMQVEHARGAGPAQPALEALQPRGSLDGRGDERRNDRRSSSVPTELRVRPAAAETAAVPGLPSASLVRCCSRRGSV